MFRTLRARRAALYATEVEIQVTGVVTGFPIPELREEWSETIVRWPLSDSIEDHAEADRRALADLPLEKTVQMSGQQARLSGNDHLRAEERFASALQEASKADIRSTNGQCVGGAEI